MNPKLESATFEDLIARVGTPYRDFLKSIAADINEEHHDAHESRRPLQQLANRSQPVGDLRCELSYPEVTGELLIESAVLPSALGKLVGKYFKDSIPPKEVFEDIFTIEFGPHLLWGTASSRHVILRGDPTRVYRFD